MDEHVLIETNYCATMYEHRFIDGRARCTAAGRYVDAEGRVICARCAAGRVVVKLTDLPRLIDLVDHLLDSGAAMNDDARAQLRALVRRPGDDLAK